MRKRTERPAYCVELRELLGADRCLHSRSARCSFAFDASPFFSQPDVVVFPESSYEVAAVMKLSGRFGVPVVARGAGTGLSGGAVPALGGCLMVLTRMDRILDIDPVSETALVEPGVVNHELQVELEKLGWMFAPDPASYKVATVGGNVAVGAGGMRGVKYGVTRNHVMGLELVLADGTRCTTGCLARGTAARPDFTGLFVGSEGTLGIVTRAVLKLTRIPEALRTALAVFMDVEDAGRAVAAMIQKGIVPTALEIMDQTMIRAVEDALHIGLPRDAQAVLLMELDGYNVEIDHQLLQLKDICRSSGASEVSVARTPEERQRLWLARRSGNSALGRIKPGMSVQDIVVPRHNIPAMLKTVREIGKRQGITIGQLAHAGDGNIHPHLLYSPEDAEEVRRMHTVARAICEAALRMGGTITGEHGIGMEKTAYMAMQFSKADLACMRSVKRGLDPGDLLNPAKVLPDRSDFARPRGANCSTGDPGALDNAAPETIDEAQRIIRSLTSGRHILPCGRLTALGPRMRNDPFPGILLSCRRMNRVLDFTPENLCMHVQAGTPLRTIQETAAAANAWVPVNAMVHADRTVGGLYAEGVEGLEGYAFGAFKEYVLGLEFVTSSGDLVKAGGCTVKNVAGFDLTRMLWRSHGTLGLLVAMTLRLVPRPAAAMTLIAELRDLSSVCRTAETIRRQGLTLASLAAIGPDVVRGHQTWRLAIGLAGTNEVVEAHERWVRANVGDVVEDDGCFIDNWMLRTHRDNHGNDQSVWVDGNRRDLIRILAALDSTTWLEDTAGMQIDFGVPGILLGWRNGSMKKRFDHFARQIFGEKNQITAGDHGMEDDDPVFQRVKTALDPRNIFPGPFMIAVPGWAAASARQEVP